MSKQNIMRHFTSEEEELLRAFLFTNPHGKEGFIYPQPLVAGEELSPLMSAVSRTHLSTQDRVLQFLDTAKPEQTRAFLPYIQSLIDIFRCPDGRLQVSRRTTSFNREYAILHGHSSIKEGTTLFGHCEDISDIAGKKITGHPLCHPQVKSTRYISFDRVLPLALEDADILTLPNADRFVAHLGFLNQRYQDVTQILTERLLDHHFTQEIVNYLRQPDIVEAEFNRRLKHRLRVDPDFNASEEYRRSEHVKIFQELEKEGVRSALGKFVLDSSRVYLPAATRTSLVFSADARTLEEIITDMISSPRLEDQQRGQALWNEAKKLSPLLLGERGHVHIDSWRVNNERELRDYFESQFSAIPVMHERPLLHLYHSGNTAMHTDRFNAALILFQYTDATLGDIFQYLTEDHIRDILSHAHHYRGERDVLHPALSHQGLVFEITMGYHGYRDIFRHRRGSRTTKLLSTRFGFETPEIFSKFGIDQEYKKDMFKAEELYEVAREQNKHAAEKLVPFGANCSALHSWHPQQVGYIGRLRGNIDEGNISYVNMVRLMADKVAEIMPETAKLLRIDRRQYPAELWKRGYRWYDLKDKG